MSATGTSSSDDNREVAAIYGDQVPQYLEAKCYLIRHLTAGFALTIDKAAIRTAMCQQRHYQLKLDSIHVWISAHQYKKGNVLTTPWDFKG